MTPIGVTWSGPRIDDLTIRQSLTSDLWNMLTVENGFILSHGALHVRGACQSPEWHSLRAAMFGPMAFHHHYRSVLPSDIPFAQDMFGDQYLIRGKEILKLSAESDDLEPFAKSLKAFVNALDDNIEEYLNVSLDFDLQPGQLLLAWPPFVVASESSPQLKAIDGAEVISLHAEIARQIRDMPDGGTFSVQWTG
jgi:hypothetical protein